MKKVCVFFSILLLALPLLSQNYQNICSKGVRLYKDYSGFLQGFRYDSLEVNGDNDSIFTSFPVMFYDSTTGVYDSSGGSILGRKITKRNNGYIVFLADQQNSFLIKPDAGLNESWACITYPSHFGIGATVTGIVSENVMNVADSVKIITFQAFGEVGPVPHPINGKSIKLSKHFGISSLYDMRNFPHIETPYELCGQTDPKAGIQPLSVKEAFNFDAGDEFHYHVVYQNFDYHGNHSDTKYILKVLSKTMAADSSEVTYTYSICYSLTYSMFPTGGGTASGSYNQAVTYDFVTMDEKYFFDKLPGEFFCHKSYADGTGYANRFSNRIMSYNTVSRVQNRIDYMSYARNSSTGGQWALFSDANPNVFLDYWTTFATGVGLTHRNEHGMYGSVNDSVLVYFKKAGETSGNPIAADCNSLIGYEDPLQVPAGIGISPNPVFSSAEVIFSGINPAEGYRFVIYNPSGREILRMDVTSLSVIFKRNGISAGLYLAALVDREGKLVAKTKFAVL